MTSADKKLNEKTKLIKRATNLLNLLLSAKIYDFDNDGIKELFLIRIEEAEEKSSVYNNQCSEYYFYGEIYKFINNTITLIDKTLIKSCDNFETDEYISFKFMSNQYCIDDLYINIVSIDNRNYILFEFNVKEASS